MRILNVFSCVLFIVFVGVQYNDPDWYLWMPVYAIVAAWAALAAWRPPRIAAASLTLALTACIVAAVAATVWLWPTEPAFWRRDVWWESETAREGMGMMIVTAGLLLVALTAVLARGRGRRSV